MVVKDELTKLGLHYTSVELGEADIVETLSPEQQDQFKDALVRSGLELMDDKKSVLIQKIKIVVAVLLMTAVAGAVTYRTAVGGSTGTTCSLSANQLRSMTEA